MHVRVISWMRHVQVMGELDELLDVHTSLWRSDNLTMDNSISHRGQHYHTWFLCQNQVLIICMTQDQLFHTYGQNAHR
jgi:hypothetical protein